MKKYVKRLPENKPVKAWRFFIDGQLPPKKINKRLIFEEDGDTVWFRTEKDCAERVSDGDWIVKYIWGWSVTPDKDFRDNFVVDDL